MWLSNIFIGYITRVECGSSSLQFSLSIPTFRKDELEFDFLLLPLTYSLYTMVTLRKFLLQTTYEEYRLNEKDVGDKSKFLKEGMDCNLLFWNGKVFSNANLF